MGGSEAFWHFLRHPIYDSQSMTVGKRVTSHRSLGCFIHVHILLFDRLFWGSDSWNKSMQPCPRITWQHETESYDRRKCREVKRLTDRHGSHVRQGWTCFAGLGHDKARQNLRGQLRHLPLSEAMESFFTGLAVQNPWWTYIHYILHDIACVMLMW